MLALNVENLVLTGTYGISGTGNTLNNVLTGNSGHNTLNGGAGNDTMVGGDGDDTYIVEENGDVVTEGSGLGSGFDTVIAYVNYTLAANAELLIVQGAATAGTGCPDAAARHAAPDATRSTHAPGTAPRPAAARGARAA